MKKLWHIFSNIFSILMYNINAYLWILSWDALQCRHDVLICTISFLFVVFANKFSTKWARKYTAFDFRSMCKKDNWFYSRRIKVCRSDKPWIRHWSVLNLSQVTQVSKIRSAKNNISDYSCWQKIILLQKQDQINHCKLSSW